jgi:hypothetical protein
MHAWEKKEQEQEWQRDEFFNKLQPMASRRQWEVKSMFEALKEAEVVNTKEQGAAETEGDQLRLRETSQTDLLHQSDRSIRDLPRTSQTGLIHQPDRSSMFLYR